MNPLLWAAALGHEHIVSLLLDAGADPNCMDQNSRTPLSYAAENNQEPLISLLLDKGALPDEGEEESPLMYAVGEDNRALVELLLEKGANPYSDMYGIVERPPLVLAASHGKETLVRRFLEREAETDVKRDHIWRALVAACEEGKTSVVKLLLEQHPFEGRSDLDDAPIWHAGNLGHEEIVELLRPYYADHKS